MARSFDAGKDEDFALMGRTDEELRYDGMSEEEIGALREAQWNAPPARSAEEVRTLRQREAQEQAQARGGGRKAETAKAEG